eukprot:1601268-Rhodomonas_salina.2
MDHAAAAAAAAADDDDDGDDKEAGLHFNKLGGRARGSVEGEEVGGGGLVEGVRDGAEGVEGVVEAHAVLFVDG